MGGNTRPQPQAHPRTASDQKKWIKNGISGDEKIKCVSICNQMRYEFAGQLFADFFVII
jgi:hypothetical protein